MIKNVFVAQPFTYLALLLIYSFTPLLRDLG
jgi:hypothetical protein